MYSGRGVTLVVELVKVVGALLAGQYRSHRGHVNPGRLLLIDGVATSEGGVVKTGGRD